MKITKKNYIQRVIAVGEENLPEELYDAHTYIMQLTENGTNWKQWDENNIFRKVAELTFAKLEQFIGNNKVGLNGPEKYSSHNEIQFIERFLALHNKRVYKNTVQIFIEELQKAILDRRIRKHSPYAKQIMRIQEVALKFYQKADFVNHLVLSKDLQKQLNDAILHYENNIERPAKIDPVELSGTEAKTQEDLVARFETKSQPELMSSVDFEKKEFVCLGFQNKWLSLIGDPCKGFTIMIFGKPKMGKSYLAIDFSGYLAKEFGKTLYVAKEEKLGATLKLKLDEKKAAHENLIVSDHLPADLAAFDFIFLDSINSLNLSPEDLRTLKEKNPGKSFIYIFQTTKNGNFRGANTFQHDVDSVIEVPERGRAIQFGRFNQGGEMDIFEDAVQEAPQELYGIKKKAQQDSLQKIHATIGFSLEELAMNYYKRESDYPKIVDLIKKDSPKIKKLATELVQSILRETQTPIRLSKVTRIKMDIPDINLGAADISFILTGMKRELDKMVGERKIFKYDWDAPAELDGKPKKVSYPEWTKPKNTKASPTDLRYIFDQYRKGNYSEALTYAYLTANEITREQIPNFIWLTMGGKLDSDRESKLKSDPRFNVELDGTKALGGKYPAWTAPKHLNEIDHAVLRRIYDLTKQGKYEQAMNYAQNTDTIVREEIPGDIWKKMGGKLTKTGEEKLRISKRKDKSGTESDSERKRKMEEPTQIIYPKLNPDYLKDFFNKNTGEKLTLEQYHKIMKIADEKFTITKLINQAAPLLSEVCRFLLKALEQYEETHGEINNTFRPETWSHMKPESNPALMFRNVDSKLLAICLEDEDFVNFFEIIKHELAGRGVDSFGRNVGVAQARRHFGLDR